MGQAEVDCAKCGKSFRVNTRYFQIFGEDAFCQDCLIHTKCQSCSRGLRLQPSRYKELGGDPVICGDCGENQSSPSTSQTSGGSTFWAGLSIGEKIVFPLLLAAFLCLGGFSLYVNLNGGEFSTPVIGGLGLLLIWLYVRGRKNK